MALEDGGSYVPGGDGAGWGDIINGAEFVAKNGALTAYNGKGGVVVIPEGITSINGSAFSGKDTVTAVIIPDGVTKNRVLCLYKLQGLKICRHTQKYDNHCL